MKPLLTLNLSLVVLIFSAAQSNAVLIDTFIGGNITNTAAPPDKVVDQSGVPGVIGSGDRNVAWGELDGIASGTVNLDINVAVPGAAVLGTTHHSANGFWGFNYGADSPFNIDLTDGGNADSFVVYFSTATPGSLTVFVNDVNDNGSVTFVEIPAMPLGGFVAIPFISLAPTPVLADLTQARRVQFGISDNTSIGNVASYSVLQISTELVVPEPSTLTLVGFVLLCLAAYTVPLRDGARAKAQMLRAFFAMR